MNTINADKLALIKQSIKTIPDYPKAGVMFRDITSLLADYNAFQATIDLFVERYKNLGFTKIVGTEARGFLFGAALALELKAGFVPVRKAGKLPRETISASYQLEYGQDKLEIHIDAIMSNDKVLIVDDLLATGGTVETTAKLIRQLGGKVNDAAFVIALPAIGGIERLERQGLELTILCEFDD